MNPADESRRLDEMSTRWDLLAKAHLPNQSDSAADARQELMNRYRGAVFRYILAATRDTHVADDLTQEFAVRFLEGRFRHANPESGRFRDYVKRSLFSLVADYRKRLHQKPLSYEGDEAEIPESTVEEDAAFLESWRKELLSRAWKALARVQEETGRPVYDVLLCRTQNPEMRSQEMAEKLTTQFGKPMTAANVRQILHRGRESFADLLLEETRHSLTEPTSQRLEEELAELNLLKYCQPALDRRKNG